MALLPTTKAAYGRACRKSRLWRYAQRLRTRPRNLSGLQAGEDVHLYTMRHD